MKLGSFPAKDGGMSGWIQFGYKSIMPLTFLSNIVQTLGECIIIAQLIIMVGAGIGLAAGRQGDMDAAAAVCHAVVHKW